MAQLDVKPADKGLDCPASWVTFSCTGKYTSKAEGFRMFESAQMAFALDKIVHVEITDEKKHNGFCYAGRIVIHDSPYIDEDSDGDVQSSI